MSEEKDLHRKFAVNCFNGTWDLIEKKDRTPEDDTDMIHMAHASRYHWGQIGTPLNFARGDWQISRVYAILGQGENALTYAKSSLHHCKEVITVNLNSFYSVSNGFNGYSVGSRLNFKRS